MSLILLIACDWLGLQLSGFTQTCMVPSWSGPCPGSRISLKINIPPPEPPWVIETIQIITPSRTHPLKEAKVAEKLNFKPILLKMRSADYRNLYPHILVQASNMIFIDKHVGLQSDRWSPLVWVVESFGDPPSKPTSTSKFGMMCSTTPSRLRRSTSVQQEMVASFRCEVFYTTPDKLSFGA